MAKRMNAVQLDRVAVIKQAWERLRATRSFSGLTLEQFTEIYQRR